MNDLVVLRSEETAEYWEGRIRPHLGKAVEHIVAAGREFIEAKASVQHGEFGRLIEMLGMGDRTVQMFMAVAGHAVLANPNHGSLLPPSWRTLYELSRLEPPALEAAIEAGQVRRDMERKDAVRLVARHGVVESSAATAPVEPRSQRRSRTDVPGVMGQVVTSADRAARAAAEIERKHLTDKSAEAAVWRDSLGQSMQTLQRLLDLLTEVAQ